MLSIDFACSEQKIAIEFDGPSHYLSALWSGQLTSTENGATKAKRRFWNSSAGRLSTLTIAIVAKRQARLQQILKMSGVAMSNKQ